MKGKHLTLADRIQIERGPNSRKNVTEIGRERDAPLTCLPKKKLQGS